MTNNQKARLILQKALKDIKKLGVTPIFQVDANEMYTLMDSYVLLVDSCEPTKKKES